jgi:hypothetical protein
MPTAVRAAVPAAAMVVRSKRGYISPSRWMTTGIGARGQVPRHDEMGEQQAQQDRGDAPTIHRVEV